MAYADFTLTTFGETWLAQCIDDAANGTTRAKVESMDFGNSAAAYVGTTRMTGSELWYSDATSVRVYSSGTSLGIRGTASNALADWNSFDGIFNAVQVIGSIDGTPGIVAYSLADDAELIPRPDVQVVQRTMTVNFATGAATSVTCAAVQSGYALEGDVVKIAPAVNVGGVTLGDGAGHTSTINCNSQGALTVSGGVRASGSLTSLGNVNAFTGLIVAQGGAQIIGDSTFSDDLTINGDAKAANLPIFAIFSRASLSDEFTGQVNGMTLTQESAATVFSAINSAASGRGIYICVDSVDAAGVIPKCVPIAYSQAMSTSGFPLPSSVGGCVLVVRWR